MTVVDGGKLRFTSYIEGPRWARLRPFLYDASNEAGVQLTVTDTDRGIVRETIYFHVEGTGDELTRFAEVCEQSIKEYRK